ncbi:LysR family transcriptional regulator [Falsiroseomonas stagni]|uniref:Transcriptional regulator, LysR family n=1 Tax=Falsiroseomonas stagni DSM 19981 TaxID=1123062 RepID=A0A1I3Z9A5_9PROT|nr:LysR family transcriptional regulator [Falsiroseomonas stagni]SFK40510.1 transcriptional regulator, LysR family [Falsiroseomonas stagni DSM 19981]
MDWHAARLDWNHLRAFLATAEAGSLSAAARQLGLTQPTLGRQVTALEGELGVVLFERAGRGLVLTPTGRDLLDHVRPMADAAARLALVATGRSQAIEGAIRITATEACAAHMLPPLVTRLRAAHPGITVEMLATNRTADLLRREADIAIRNFASRDGDLIVRKVGEDRGRPYATPAVIERLGRPASLADLAAADFVGFGDPDDFIDGLRGFGINLSRRQIPVVVDSYLVHWALVRQGAGIGFITEAVGDAEPAVRRVLPDAAPIVFPVWLATHRELHTSRRIRVVFDLLAEELGAMLGTAPGAGALSSP